eukprot:362672-Chlamydomonas_euryale.AAC.11
MQLQSQLRTSASTTKTWVHRTLAKNLVKELRNVQWDVPAHALGCCSQTAVAPRAVAPLLKSVHHTCCTSAQVRASHVHLEVHCIREQQQRYMVDFTAKPSMQHIAAGARLFWSGEHQELVARDAAYLS